ncbi:MAG: flagellar basal body-associated FliL family protein [Bdellovibrionota bacterium]
MSGANKEQAEGGETKKRDFGKLMLPLFAVLNLAVVGGGAFLTYKATLAYEPPVLREPAAAAELEKKNVDIAFTDPVMYTMPGFVVNLSGTPRRLIKVEMTFEMLDKDGFEEIVRNSPSARDTIVRILNRKSFDDVETIQGKLFLKDQIAVALNQSMKAGVVKDIYFNDFVVQ